MMTLVFQCCLIVGILIYLGVIVVLLKKQKLNLRYADVYKRQPAVQEHSVKMECLKKP